MLDLSDSVLLESNNSVVFKLTNIVKLLADRYRFAETLMAIWIEFSVDSSVVFTAVVIGVGPGPIVWASIQSGSNSILDKEFRTLVLFRRSLINTETSLVKSKCKNQQAIKEVIIDFQDWLRDQGVEDLDNTDLVSKFGKFYIPDDLVLENVPQ